MTVNIILLIAALAVTLLIEVPYVYFVMKYKAVRNIIAVNVFTNVFLNTVFFLLDSFGNYHYLDPDIWIIVLAVFELFIIPVAESWFYVKTDTYGLSKKRIIVNTYAANIISCITGVILTEVLYMMI